MYTEYFKRTRTIRYINAMHAIPLRNKIMYILF
jgi:hypothetical protein